MHGEIAGEDLTSLSLLVFVPNLLCEQLTVVNTLEDDFVAIVNLASSQTDIEVLWKNNDLYLIMRCILQRHPRTIKIRIGKDVIDEYSTMHEFGQQLARHRLIEYVRRRFEEYRHLDDGHSKKPPRVVIWDIAAAIMYGVVFDGSCDRISPKT